MNEKLSHLTKEQIETLIARYYAKEKISDLIREYNLDLRASQLVGSFPPEILVDKCKYCLTNIIRPRVSRDNLRWGILEYCPFCGHKQKTHCSCKNCLEEEKQKQKMKKVYKQNFIDKWLKKEENDKLEVEQLSLIEKIFLGALLREGISEDYSYIKPIQTFINPLAPTEEYSLVIIDYLQSTGNIVIHPQVNPELIQITDYDNGQYSYHPDEVAWELNLKSNRLNRVQLIESLINPTELQRTSCEDIIWLWRIIALHESIEYLQYNTAKILGVNYVVGEKTKNVLTNLINDYSVSQIYGMIYKSTNEALRFQKENDTNAKHAANTIIGKVQSLGERAKISGWDLQKYGRVKYCPESSLSKFFFGRVLKIGYDGFNEVPDIKKVNALMTGSNI